MAYPGCLILLLELIVAYLCLMPLQAAALSFHYDFSHPGVLDRAGLVYFNNSAPASDRINLTAMSYFSTGRVAYPQPVRLWDSHIAGVRANFTTSFSFAINGNRNTSRGDGIAFFIGPFPPDIPQDSWGAFLGLFSNQANHMGKSPPIVAVEFDTFWNKGLDPLNVTDHVGIDIGNIFSTNYTRNLPKLALSGTMSASIAYDGGSGMMVVTLRLATGRSYSIQTPVDFKAVGVQQDAAIGFSAATGRALESHQLLSWSFNSTDIIAGSSSKNNLWWWILVGIAALVLFAGSVVALRCIVIRRRARRPTTEIVLPVAREFSYNELSTATANFFEGRKLGAGAFGEVYEGVLPDPSMPRVAVKRLTRLEERTRRDYKTEIMTLGQLRHRKLVKLVGWCDGGGNDERLLLVYELVSNGNLDQHLHGSERPLTWPERYRVVLGIGSAIEYLHTCSHSPILHRDIKPGNVMLDENFEAKLGDFGLVRQVRQGQSVLEDTTMIGSWDYMDPNCISNRVASTASDMYSFGILLLEVGTGVRPAAVHEAGRLSNTLVDAVRDSYRRNALLQMADGRLNGHFDEGQMQRVLVVGLSCVHLNPQNRPGIRTALNSLSSLGHPAPEIRE